MAISKKIGMGGGCHWCTEAVVIHYQPEQISLEVLMEIHLRTHESTSSHSFRKKYRSAVYTFTDADYRLAKKLLARLQENFDSPLVTQILPFGKFKASRESLLDYYFTDRSRPFCQRYIEPKIQLLIREYSARVAKEKF